MRAWRSANGEHAGKEAGIITKAGYRYVRFADREKAYAVHTHRIGWALHTGKWPARIIDHINRDPLDNRFVNLREATPSQNRANTPVAKWNKTGLKGASPWGKRFRAQIRDNGKTVYLGMFDTPEEAHDAYRAASDRLFGEFARYTA